jgi:hypothetical protein
MSDKWEGFLGSHDVVDLQGRNLLLPCHPQDCVIEHGVDPALKEYPFSTIQCGHR